MRVLIVEDEKTYAQMLKRLLEKEGYEDVALAQSGEEALEKLAQGPFDVLVSDICLPGMSGLDLVPRARKKIAGLDVILMTAFADIASAREALRQGALDYLEKPFDNKDILSLLSKVQARRQARGNRSGTDTETFDGMITSSSVMHEIFRKIDKAARSQVPVLICGESGTGKELAARAVHQQSDRSEGPFVVIHSPALPDTLLESELFGHEKGAFTGADTQKTGKFEVANGGTLFFDEIGEMPLRLQPKLLRFLQNYEFNRVGGSQSKSVDVRVIAATNRDLDDELRAGNFREDLFYRLDVVRITIPPLRERPEDIEPLAKHFIRQQGYPETILAPDALRILQEHQWPGNVRELINVIESAVIETEGENITAETLSSKISSAAAQKRNGSPAPQAVEDETSTLDLQDNEARLIQKALKQSEGNKSKAAELLGITRRRLYSRMDRLGLTSKD